jgi:SAM-dependent methyltransferase
MKGPALEHFIPKAVEADLSAGVDLYEASYGYSESEEKAKFFIAYGIVPIQGDLPRSPHDLVYLDFGGGEGFLAGRVSDHLARAGHSPVTTVLDANTDFLEKAKARGLNTVHCNLEEIIIPGSDLVTMRAVLHYNPKAGQARILKNAFRSLNPGGYLVSHLTTGSDESCALRSELANLPELGRNGDVCYVSTRAYLTMLGRTGKWESYLTATDNSCPWRLENQWRRFNPDGSSERREAFYREAEKVIQKYVSWYGEEVLGLSRTENGYEIECDMPIVISQRK